MPKQNTQTTPSKTNKDRSKGFDLLQDSIWIVAFLKDVALSHALLSEDPVHPPITPDGSQGLGLILAGVERDLKEAHDIL